MFVSKKIFSLQIVTADFYMESPKPGLDPFFSEFLSKEIKKVPIVRIFGSNADGIKTCLHVHGIFPYLYIPFDKKDFETLEKGVFSIGVNLDKAINISLGQSAGSQHVFKIELVKGIPFYGYHQNEHQFLKVYMLNPRLIKRAANLLQTGAIMGKIFHTHESHVPYILQFFIDYNLYGMSFLHVPLEVLKFRRKNEKDDIPYAISNQHILDCNVAARQSISKLEVDIVSGFILNRFQLETKVSTHANPGIESIWQDERVRRQNLANNLETVVPLVIPSTEERSDIKPTKSDIFYRAELKNKLTQLETDLDHNTTDILGSYINPFEGNNKKKKKTSNPNSVYPGECTQEDLLTNASFVTNHFLSGGFFETLNEVFSETKTQDLDDVFMDNSVADQSFKVCLSQSANTNETLLTEDVELLNVMQHLGEEEGEYNVDLDSTLAPLSENTDCNNSEDVIEKLSPNDLNEDFDNECLDFTLVMEDMDELLVKLSQPSFSEVIEINGADKSLETPNKNKKSLMINKDLGSVEEKCTTLSPLIQSRNVRENSSDANQINGVCSHSKTVNHLAAVPADKLKQRQTVDLDRIQITELRPEPNKLGNNSSKSKILQNYCLETTNEDETSNKHLSSLGLKVDINKSSSPENLQEGLEGQQDIPKSLMTLKNNLESSCNKPDLIRTFKRVKVKRCPLIKAMTQNLRQKPPKELDVECLKSNNKIFKSLNSPVKETELSAVRIPSKSKKTTNHKSSRKHQISIRIKKENFSTLNLDSSLCRDSVSIDNLDSVKKSIPNVGYVVIRPIILTETYEDVKNGCKTHDLPKLMHGQPFYSNYHDSTTRKEVGNTVLCIPSRSLCNVDNFRSTIPYLHNFSIFRRNMIQVMITHMPDDDCIRKYLSTDKLTRTAPSKLPPAKLDVKIWLKAKKLLKEQYVHDEKNPEVEEESPIKVKTECEGILEDKVPLKPLESVAENTSNLSSNQFLTIGRTKAEPKANLKKYSEFLKTSKQIDGNNLTSQTMKRKQNSKPLETVSNTAVMAEMENESFGYNMGNKQGDCSFGIRNVTLNNTFGFKLNLENLQHAKSVVDHNLLTALSLEIFVPTRGDLLPNPQLDAIAVIFYAIESNITSVPSPEEISTTSGLIIMYDENVSTFSKFNAIDSNMKVKKVGNEVDGLIELVQLCQYWDPDIFVGYEIEMSSWGYIIDRAKYLSIDIAMLLSRVPNQKVSDFTNEDRDRITDLDTETKLCGRILLDVWRLMRSEIALTSYSFENVMFHIMHRRCPRHTPKDLSLWFVSSQTRWITLEYYLERVNGTLALLHQLDIIGRTSEMAKLIGIQFYEVLSRGSQFRVESMMLRIAKPMNLVSFSPSVQQRAYMRAPEYLPLILEPKSRFYSDPMIVLDFQSLYPSMIMAYNYCFSTCLGRIENLGQSTPFEFGASQLRVSPSLLKELSKRDMLNISPCGVVFVKKEVREGILPRMLKEILDTRQMVKQSMKLHKKSAVLQRILHSRQLCLKLIANVTYGYTAANFSGRMPCVEVGDSVVAKGRETLERAIKLIESNEEWNVKIVYGDTDSLFVLVPGGSRTEAFKIGSEIAEYVTQNNPHPVKLKLEKVYQPCILQTKKRYVGYMFESPDQIKPIYEAKGIETVRRDGCPAVAKILEKTLRILFDSVDVSQVKKYICHQFSKLLSGKANLQDLIFAKEFRGLKGYKPTACVPALELTRKWIQSDPRKIPRCGERVPFIVINGPPGLPLIKLVRSPDEVLADGGLKINAIYYITKAIIPPLNRCLLLIGADVNEWFVNLPRKSLYMPAITSSDDNIISNAKSVISQYFSSTNCITECGRQTTQRVCTFCSKEVSTSLIKLEDKFSKLQREYFFTQFICQSCCGRSNFISCASLDCPVLYVLKMKSREITANIEIKNILNNLFKTELR